MRNNSIYRISFYPPYPKNIFYIMRNWTGAPISIGKATNYGTIPLAKYGTRTAAPPEKKVR